VGDKRVEGDKEREEGKISWVQGRTNPSPFGQTSSRRRAGRGRRDVNLSEHAERDRGRNREREGGGRESENGEQGRMRERTAIQSGE
jgi:hypothetical protein